MITVTSCVLTKLCEKGHVHGALVWAGLLHAGYMPGEQLTMNDATYSLRASAYVVRKGLNDGRVFGKGISPFSTGGRPPALYTMPSESGLIRSFLISGEGAMWAKDRLWLADLVSVSAFRKALHRELLARNRNQRTVVEVRDGWLPVIAYGAQFSRAWLGRRIGVGKATTRRYDVELDVWVQRVPPAVEPLTHEHLTDGTLKYRRDECSTGVYLRVLQDDGWYKRYPPLRAVAVPLLESEADAEVCRYQPNVYLLPPERPYLEYADEWQAFV